MDADRFDRLTAAFAARTPRRSALGWLAGAVLGAGFEPLPLRSTLAGNHCAPPGGCPHNRHGVRADDGQCVCVCDHPGPGPSCCADEWTCPHGVCVKKTQCCPEDRICTTKSKGKVQRVCVPRDQCCPGDRQCPSGCVDENGCCPNERACRQKVHGKVHTTCIPRDQCCPNDVPCPIVLDGCCNGLAGEECATLDGCCPVLEQNKKVCAGKWCCDKDDKCDPVHGCVSPSNCAPEQQECRSQTGAVTCCDQGDLCCDGECCPGANRCCDNICCYGAGPCLSGAGCCHDADAFWCQRADGNFCCPSNSRCVTDLSLRPCLSN